MRSLLPLSAVACLLPLTFALAACSGTDGAPVEDEQGSRAATEGEPAATPGTATPGTEEPSTKGKPVDPPAAPKLDCSTVASGPIAPQLVLSTFSGSEDLAFDGLGHIAAKRGAEIVLVDAQGTVTPLANLNTTVFGLRYRQDGVLIAALPGAGKLAGILPDGRLTLVADGLGGPNGVFAGFDGDLYVTEFQGNQVTRITSGGTRQIIATGAATARSANGIVIDRSKNRLFYTEYSKGRINRLDVPATDSSAPGEPVAIATIPGAALDGLVLDACGNVYVVDQGGSKVYRVKVDAEGNAAGAPELLATFPTNVANAQFGSGPGFDSTKLYVTGNPGKVYSLAIGVPGAEVVVPTPPATK